MHATQATMSEDEDDQSPTALENKPSKTHDTGEGLKEEVGEAAAAVETKYEVSVNQPSLIVNASCLEQLG